MYEEVFIVDAKRTAIGKFGGGLSRIPATTIAAVVLKALINANPKIRKHISEVILGNTLSGGLGQNPARIASYRAGISYKIPAFTVNKVCGSSLRSIISAVHAISNNDAEVIIAGGMENMSGAPYILENYRFGGKMGHKAVKDSMIYDGLFCSLIGEHMGMTAEHIAKKYKISREKQDAYALSSHKKAIAAIERKNFTKEIVSVVSNKNESFFVDEQPRKDTSLHLLQKLKPAFKKGGTVTAGNAASLNDGAAAVILVSKKFLKKHKLKPIAKILSSASIGLNPKYMGLGTYEAAKKSLKKAGLKPSSIDLWELNEAFASQSIAVLKLLGIDSARVNVNGGALALGHPIGASGARILTTLLYELKRQKRQYGVASLCIGGGQGIAVTIENI